MELCLEQLKRDVLKKQVRASECFANQVLSIWNLFKEMGEKREIFDLVLEYYSLRKKYDDFYTRRISLRNGISEKTDELKKLQEQYNQIGNTDLDRKISLGYKI
jgi:hypothetical protein